MFNKKILVLSLICIFFILTIGVVSANDNLTQNLNSNSDNATFIPVNNDKTFKDVTQEIEKSKENDEIILDGKYVSEGSEIKIDKKLKFKGQNNAILDGNKISTIITSTKDVTFENITFMNSYSKNSNAAIQAKSSLIFINCNFINNQGTSSNINSASVISTQESLQIINCNFKDNTAKLNIIFVDGELTLKNSEFSNNNALTILSVLSKSQFENSKFINNKATAIESYFNTYINYCEFSNNNLGVLSSKLNLKNSNFNNNNYGVEVYDNEINIIIDNCNFTNNNYYAISTLATSKISNSNFIKNGIGIKSIEEFEYWLDLGTITAENCLFKSNTNTAIYSYSSLNIKKCIFEDNIGELAGAIYSCSPGNYEQASLKISDSTFKNNFADYAGAIKIEGSDSTISNSKFENNKQTSIIVTSTRAVGHDELEICRNIGKLTINSKKYSNVNFNDKLNSVSIAKVTTKKITTSYHSGVKLTVTLINKLNNKPIKNSQLHFKVYTGKKYKYYYYEYSNSKGIVKFSASNLDVGTHKIIISSENGVCNFKKITTYAKITKGKTIVKAPKVTNKYKKSKYFKVTVKNKANKKSVKKLVLKVKVGKKTYKIKTNSKGVAKLNTKKLNIGKHKVVISSGNSNYQVSGKSVINIKR